MPLDKLMKTKVSYDIILFVIILPTYQNSTLMIQFQSSFLNIKFKTSPKLRMQMFHQARLVRSKYDL